MKNREPRPTPLAGSCLPWLLAGLAVALPELAATAAAAPQTDRERPRIGLVLSGGGARGAAHIGVLEVLEELRVPVDVIAGASMGAIVGGLYAAGMSPADLRAELSGMDWGDAFRDGPARQHLSFRRKQDDLNFLTRFRWGVKGGGLALPKGLIQGQKLSQALTRLVVSASNVEDFDALPIPFRAVATDIETGEAVILGRGDLALAMRASMSVPAVFAPVELDGRLLVDGGVANNLPVDVAREMGADVVIAVDISTPLSSREALQSVIDISAQVTTILTRTNVRAQLRRLGPEDLLIAPDLTGFSSADFARAREIVLRGGEAARAAAAVLERWSLPPSEYTAVVRGRRRGSAQPSVVKTVRVINDSRMDSAVIERRLRTRPGEPLDLEELQQDVNSIYGLGTFERVEVDLEERNGETEVVVKAVEKSWGPHYLRFGLNVEENFQGSSLYNLAVNYTRMPVNSLGAEWRNELQIGHTLRVFSEFYQPLDYDGRYFAAPRFDFVRTNLDLFEGGDRVAELRVRQLGLGLDLGRQLGNWGELRAGVGWAHGRARADLAEEPLPRFDLETGGVFLRFAYDTLDNSYFPRSGSIGGVTVGFVRDELGAPVSYEALEADWFKAISFGRNTLVLGASLGTALGSSAPLTDLFTLGGFLSLSGFQRDELRGQHLGIVRAIGYRRIAEPRLFSIELPLYLGGSLELGNVWGDRRDISLSSARVAGSIFLGFETLLGPLYLAYGYAEGGNGSAYLFLGRTF